MSKSFFDVEKAIQLRADGMTYTDIADVLGVSRQRVWQKLNDVNARERAGGKVYDSIPYNGLYEMFQSDKTLTIPQFCRECFGTGTHTFTMKIYNLLSGKDGHLTVGQTRKLLKYSGKTWEELFEPRNQA